MEQSREGARTRNQGGRNRLVTGVSKYTNKEVRCLKGSVSSGMTRSRLRKKEQPKQKCHSCPSSWSEDIWRSEYSWATGQGSRPKRQRKKTPRTWWASVYGVAQSRTRLKRLSSSSSGSSVLLELLRWCSGKESPANAGDVGDTGLIPGLGRFPGVGEFHRQRCLEGYSLQGCRVRHD